MTNDKSPYWLNYVYQYFKIHKIDYLPLENFKSVNDYIKYLIKTMGEDTFYLIQYSNQRRGKKHNAIRSIKINKLARKYNVLNKCIALKCEFLFKCFNIKKNKSNPSIIKSYALIGLCDLYNIALKKKDNELLHFFSFHNNSIEKRLKKLSLINANRIRKEGNEILKKAYRYKHVISYEVKQSKRKADQNIIWNETTWFKKVMASLNS